MIRWLHHGPVSLRARLTIWLGLVLGVALLGFTVAVYSLLAQDLSGEVDRSLAERARQVNSAVRLSPTFPLGSGVRVEVPRPDSFTWADTFVQLVTLDGEVVGASQNLGEVALPVTSEDLSRARSGQQGYDYTELNGERIRVFNAPLLVRGQPVGLIQVARSLARVDLALGQLRLLAGSGLAVAIGLSSLVVWVTSRAALRPLEQVIETAEVIGSSADLDRRVAVTTSRDEAGRLASTFNQMLSRLEQSAGDLRAAYHRLDEALEAQRRFVADASHELRTPLTTIRNNAGLLEQFPQVTPEDRAATIAQIGREAERMSRLVEELLTLARADAGQSLVRQPVALRSVVEESVALARTISSGQELVKSVGPGEGDLSGDPDSLRQLVLILLDNALKHTPAGGQVQVGLAESPEWVELTVADTGEGIAAEHLPHLFDRFYRADPSRKAGGTGLGLSIARWIAEQHDATIQVASEPGQGATFTVRFLRNQPRPAPRP